MPKPNRDRTNEALDELLKIEECADTIRRLGALDVAAEEEPAGELDIRQRDVSLATSLLAREIGSAAKSAATALDRRPQ